MQVVDAHNIDEIVYVCGTTCLPGLDDFICFKWRVQGRNRNIIFTWDDYGRKYGDTTILGLGYAFQPAIILSISDIG